MDFRAVAIHAFAQNHSPEEVENLIGMLLDKGAPRDDHGHYYKEAGAPCPHSKSSSNNNEKQLKSKPESSTISSRGEPYQSNAEGSLPPEYENDFSDFDELSFDEGELNELSRLNGLAKDTGFEHGMVKTGSSESEPFTSGKVDRVEIPGELLKEDHLQLFHAHTNASTLSGKDFELLTMPNVDSVSVEAINGDVYRVSIGNGWRPSREEFADAMREVSQMADLYVMDYPGFQDWTIEQRKMMAIREQAILITRRFGWRMEGGHP